MDYIDLEISTVLLVTLTKSTTRAMKQGVLSNQSPSKNTVQSNMMIQKMKPRKQVICRYCHYQKTCVSTQNNGCHNREILLIHQKLTSKSLNYGFMLGLFAVCRNERVTGTTMCHIVEAYEHRSKSIIVSLTISNLLMLPHLTRGDASFHERHFRFKYQTFHSYYFGMNAYLHSATNVKLNSFLVAKNMFNSKLCV